MREETRCCHMGYSFRLTARVLLYASSHRQEDSTYHGLCYTSRGALAGTRNSSMGPPHEGSIRRPIVPRVNALTTKLHLTLLQHIVIVWKNTNVIRMFSIFRNSETQYAVEYFLFNDALNKNQTQTDHTSAGHSVADPFKD